MASTFGGRSPPFFEPLAPGGAAGGAVEVEPVASGDLDEVGDAPVLDPFAGEAGIAEAVAGVGDYADAVNVEDGL